MSRSGYSEDCENLELYRNAVERALKGKRGQKFLRAMAAALDAMPEKTLIADELVDANGDCCALGAVCKARNLDLVGVDYFDSHYVGKVLGIAPAMAAEIAYMNDEWWDKWNNPETPPERWARMRAWVAAQIEGDK